MSTKVSKLLPNVLDFATGRSRRQSATLVPSSSSGVQNGVIAISSSSVDITAGSNSSSVGTDGTVVLAHNAANNTGSGTGPGMTASSSRTGLSTPLNDTPPTVYPSTSRLAQMSRPMLPLLTSRSRGTASLTATQASYSSASTSFVPTSLSASNSNLSKSQPEPLLTLQFTTPTILSSVVIDGTRQMYTIETNGLRTFVKWADDRPDRYVFQLQWPSAGNSVPDAGGLTAGKGATDIMVQIGRQTKSAKDMLRKATLSSSQKFNIPNFEHTLKWTKSKELYILTSPTCKRPIASFEPAYLSAPPRIKIFETLYARDETRPQLEHRGVPVMLIDYVLLTAILLVANFEEWLRVEHSRRSGSLSISTGRTSSGRGHTRSRSRQLHQQQQQQNPHGAATGGPTHDLSHLRPQTSQSHTRTQRHAKQTRRRSASVPGSAPQPPSVLDWLATVPSGAPPPPEEVLEEAEGEVDVSGNGNGNAEGQQGEGEGEGEGLESRNAERWEDETNRSSRSGGVASVSLAVPRPLQPQPTRASTPAHPFAYAYDTAEEIPDTDLDHGSPSGLYSEVGIEHGLDDIARLEDAMLAQARATVRAATAADVVASGNVTIRRGSPGSGSQASSSRVLTKAKSVAELRSACVMTPEPISPCTPSTSTCTSTSHHHAGSRPIYRPLAGSRPLPRPPGHPTNTPPVPLVPPQYLVTTVPNRSQVQGEPGVGRGLRRTASEVALNRDVTTIPVNAGSAGVAVSSKLAKEGQRLQQQVPQLETIPSEGGLTLRAGEFGEVGGVSSGYVDAEIPQTLPLRVPRHSFHVSGAPQDQSNGQLQFRLQRERERLPLRSNTYSYSSNPSLGPNAPGTVTTLRAPLGPLAENVDGDDEQQQRQQQQPPHGRQEGVVGQVATYDPFAVDNGVVTSPPPAYDSHDFSHSQVAARFVRPGVDHAQAHTHPHGHQSVAT